ncbi:MAG: biopolymer transporter ExbD, partial [Phycisphaerae bacterium]|nr:biopolymer transporter ExbD [Phycisphaerae bacterium]
MLLTRQSLKPVRPVLNIAAMIDVVFLLLIFFMCTISFEAVDKDLSAQIPQVSGDPSEESDFEPIRIELRLTEAEA